MQDILKSLGLKEINDGCSTGSNWFANGDIIESYSPVDGKLIAKVKTATKADYQKIINAASEGFKYWRSIPAPKRGEIVRQFGDKLRAKKADLGKLVSYDSPRYSSQALVSSENSTKASTMSTAPMIGPKKKVAPPRKVNSR